MGTLVVAEHDNATLNPATLNAVAAAASQPVPDAEAGVRDQVKALCAQFPIY